MGVYTLLKKCNAVYSVFFIFFIGFYTICVGNILTGIFVDHAFKNAMPDREQCILDERRRVLEEADDFREFFMQLETSVEGHISHDDFAVLMNRPTFLAY